MIKTSKDYDKAIKIVERRALAGIETDGVLKTASEYAREAKLYMARRVEDSLKEITTAIIKKAKQGDVMAFVALMDRAHGKPVQQTEITGKDGNPVVFMPLDLIQKHALEMAQNVIEVNSEKPEIKELREAK